MIQQHLLQQQRLNNNHDRLLERYHRILTPGVSQFRAFGTSALPGRNYEQYLSTIHGTDGRRNSLVAHSRASIGSSSETYRLMGEGASKTLPNNITSVIQHSRQQSIPLVHAEKFEPVHVYDHPRFGPTPAYLRPIYDKKPHLEDINDHHSDVNEDSDGETENFDVRSHTSGDISLKTDQKEEVKPTLTTIENHGNDQDDNNKLPMGYISYRKWKAKHESLIPVNPLLYSIYTGRPNGSIDRYGQSLYASPPRRPRFSHDNDDDHGLLTPLSSEIGSVTSELPQETSLTSLRRYNRLQPQLLPKTVISRPMQPTFAG
jgi:hypothetical protein